MSVATDLPQKVVPAQLGFFAIYNPSLGTTDETIANQILYYSSHDSRDRKLKRKDDASHQAALREEVNEQLRQIGLAQGMVEFGRSFSDGASVDTIETEKSRIILHELEAGWWVLASINLKVLPPSSKSQSSRASLTAREKVEYSAREVKPAILLLGDILRAHSTFLLHHASSMSALFVRTKRSKFVGLLGRYWDMFLATWTVLMHGNPATNLYGGIKLAACGELGVGVGEEDRGSGEREVLEGFVGRIDGLVDVIVSKFGDDVEHIKSDTGKPQQVSPWLGSGQEPSVSDGVVFVGTGALSRKSVRDVSHWVEDLYRWGPYAYGVLDNPSSNRRPRRSRRENKDRAQISPSITPRPLSKSSRNPEVVVPDGPLRENSQQSISSVESDTPKSNNIRKRPSFRRGLSFTSTESETSTKTTSKLVQYLKLGYGTHWTLGHHSDNAQKKQSTNIKSEITDKHRDVSLDLALRNQAEIDSQGHFLIGFLGDLEDARNAVDSTKATSLTAGEDEDDGENDRVLLRTLTVELERVQDARAEAEISIDLGSSSTETRAPLQAGSERTGTSATSFESQDRNKTKKLRVVVYVKQPFVFVMLFELRTEVLAMPGLYRSLHHQLSPLHKPLLNSTTYRMLKPDVATKAEGTPIYDLIWDPKTLIVTSTIPNIPDPYHVHYSSFASSPWSRLEALNTHMQIVLTYISATASTHEHERTCKTSRGWWIVWTRVPDTDPPATPLPQKTSKRTPGLITNDTTESMSLPPGRRTPLEGSTAGTSVSGPAHPFLEAQQKAPVVLDREIFLIRRASDHASSKISLGSSGSITSADNWTTSPGKLMHGIGVDTKWYIESLLSLSK